jgi:hypothetical protein
MKPKNIIFNIVIMLIFANGALGQNYFAGLGAGTGNTGTNNTAVGINPLQSNNSGDFNAAFGNSAMKDNTSGYANSALGAGALQKKHHWKF